MPRSRYDPFSRPFPVLPWMAEAYLFAHRLSPVEEASERRGHLIGILSDVAPTEGILFACVRLALHTQS